MPPEPGSTGAAVTLCLAWERARVGERHAARGDSGRGRGIDPAELPPHIAAGTGLAPSTPLQQHQSLADIEKAHILHTLERHGWKYAQAAETLGISRTTLWRKLKEYDLAPADAGAGEAP